MQSARFRDPLLQNKIDEEGFALIEKFLPPDEISELHAMYLDKHQTWKEDTGQWNTISDLGLDEGIEISQKLLSYLKNKLDSIFEEWSAPVATFMSKYPGNQSICHIHRDYSVLDEAKQEYWNIWIPLIDITENNGALFVLPRSHKVFNQLLPFLFSQEYNQQNELLLKHVNTIYPHAGDLVIYKDKTLHGSHRNLTGKTRPVIHLGVFSLNPQFYYYQANNSERPSELLAYKVTSNFFFGGDFDEKVKGRTPDFTLPYSLPDYSGSEIQRILAKGLNLSEATESNL